MSSPAVINRGSSPKSEGSAPSESFNRGKLCMKLLNEEFDAKKHFDNWFTATSDDWITREKDFVQLLFHSIGWFSFKYSDFQQMRIVKAHISREPMQSRNPALELTYLKNYDEFLSCIFDEYDFSNNPGGLRFLNAIGGSVLVLLKGNMDSYRVIAVRTGMKLLNLCFKLLEVYGDPLTSFASYNSSVNSVGDLNDSDILTADRHFSAFKRSMIDQFFPCAIRDVCQEVRQIVFHGMFEWSNWNPALLLNPKFKKYIIFGLYSDPDLYVMSALNNVFKESIDTTRQQQLLEGIQGSLENLLWESGEAGAMCIEIMNSAARYLDVKNILEENFQEDIYKHIFHPDKILAVGAAKFIFYSRMNPVTNPTAFLSDLAIFCNECTYSLELSAEELLVDTFCSIMMPLVKWEHWLELLRTCAPPLTVGCAKLFVNFVKKVTTNHIPKGRSKIVYSISRKDMTAIRDGFTTFLSTQYGTILNIDNIRLKPEAQSLIIHSMKFFNRKISSKVAVEIISLLSNIIRSNTNLVVVASCWSALAHLKMTATLDASEKYQLNSLLDTLKRHVKQDFIDFVTSPGLQSDSKLIEIKILGLINSGEIDAPLWEFCYTNLQSEIDRNPNGAAISVMLEVLSNMVFLHYKLVDESARTDEQDDELFNLSDSRLSDDDDLSRDLNKLLFRFSGLQKCALLLIGKRFDLHIRFKAFHVLSRALECFGKHIVQHPILILISGTVVDRVEDLIVEFAYEAMKWSPTGPNRAQVERGVCCDVLTKISLQFGTNYIDILKISDFLQLISDPNSCAVAHMERHGVEVMSALKTFAKNFPNSCRRVAVAIFKSVRGLLEDSRSSTLNRTNFLAAQKTLESWRMYEDFEEVVRIPQINMSLTMMFNVWTAQTGQDTIRQLGVSLTCQSISRLGAGMPLLGRGTDDATIRTSAQDSVISYAAFRQRAGIGHSTFAEPIADSTSDGTEP